MCAGFPNTRPPGLVRRHKWRRQTDNRGLVRALVPIDALDRPADRPGAMPTDRPTAGPNMAGAMATLESAIATHEAVITTLREQLAAAEKRTDAAESRAERAEQGRGRPIRRLRLSGTGRCPA